MNEALRAEVRTAEDRTRKLDWRRKMSDHVAYALLVYTALQIFVTMGALKSGHGSILPELGLIVLIAAIIPGCRMFEKRWSGLSDGQAANPELANRFRQDMVLLWTCAFGLPIVLTLIFKGVAALI